MPPSTAATKPLMPGRKPIEGWAKLKYAPERMPARAPMADPMAKTIRIVRAGSRPISAAARGPARRGGGGARQHGRQEAPARPADEHEAEVGPQHEHAAVAEVDDLEHAEDEGEADGDGGVDAAQGA